jgi:glutamate N-acetyltransferase/amino-acid N-acetyltransferase
MHKRTVQLPKGFSAAGVHAGLKKNGKLDMALLFSSFPAATAGMVTTNRVKAAPARHTEQRLNEKQPIQAILINASNANCLTGTRGMQDVLSGVQWVSQQLGIPSKSILFHSTGVIGVPLPMKQIFQGIKLLTTSLSPAGGFAAAHAILTTDQKAKIQSKVVNIHGTQVKFLGIAKGSGMIHPAMATMLVYLMTDLNIQQALWRQIIHEAIEKSFHCITVDGDTSTNDTVIGLANGASGNTRIVSSKDSDLFKVRSAVENICLELARDIIRDAEGATKFITIKIQKAKTPAQARQAGMAVAQSLLVKTTLFGGDPNWGRILAAVGYSGADIQEMQTKVRIEKYLVFNGGKPVRWEREKLRKLFSKKEITIEIQLNLGVGQAEIYTCDLGTNYIEINGRYTT